MGPGAPARPPAMGAGLTRTLGRSAGTSDTMLWWDTSLLVAARRFPPAALDMSKADLISGAAEGKGETRQEWEARGPAALPLPGRPRPLPGCPRLPPLRPVPARTPTAPARTPTAPASTEAAAPGGGVTSAAPRHCPVVRRGSHKLRSQTRTRGLQTPFPCRLKDPLAQGARVSPEVGVASARSAKPRG